MENKTYMFNVVLYGDCGYHFMLKIVSGIFTVVM
jgi:hypothetical protein